MPGSLNAWFSLFDLESLAEREATLSGELELRQLTRLQDILHSDSGSVRASLKFSRRPSPSLAVDLALEASLVLTCQRCLEPMRYGVSENVSLILIQEDVPDGQRDRTGEALILDGGRLRPAAVIEDELIVSLPIIPRHANVEECGDIAQALQALLPEESPESPVSARRQF